MRVGVMVMVFGSACFVTPVMHFGGGKSPQEAQYEQLERVTPASLAAQQSWKGEVSTARVHVWADDQYRAQNLKWQQTFSDELDATNQVLEGSFGLRLVPEFHVWERHAPGESLSESLAALAQVDAGDDALTVIGLTSSLGLVSATFDQLGVANINGNHMMIRGYADVEERKYFERAFTELRAEEKDVLYQSRRRHKTTAILLHELGHNFGADHVGDEDTLMHEMYSEKSSAFDAKSREVILATLDQRLRRNSAHDAPKTASASAEPQAAHGTHPKIVIGVTETGQLMFGGHVLDEDTLAALFVMSFKDDPLTQVVVKPAPHAPKVAIAGIVERAKAAGLTQFTVAIE